MVKELTVKVEGVEFRVTSEQGQPVIVCPDGEVIGPKGVYETAAGLITGQEIIDAARAKIAAAHDKKP